MLVNVRSTIDLAGDAFGERGREKRRGRDKFPHFGCLKVLGHSCRIYRNWAKTGKLEKGFWPGRGDKITDGK